MWIGGPANSSGQGHFIIVELRGKKNRSYLLSNLEVRRVTLRRDQREWVFEVREVKSEKEKLSLFFEKCKVKKKCFHSFSRSAK